MARKIHKNTIFENDIAQNSNMPENANVQQDIANTNGKKIINLSSDGTEQQLSLEVEIKKLTEENSSLKDKFAEYINDIDALKDKINELKADNDKLLIKVSQLSFENAQLQSLLNPSKRDGIQCCPGENNSSTTSKPIGYYKQQNAYANNGYTSWN